MPPIEAASSPRQIVRSRGRVVHDYDVSHDYSGVARRSIKALSLLKQGGPAEIVINVFEAQDVAVATPCYMPIDLNAGRLFGNQTYAYALTHWKGQPRIDGDTYEYQVDAPRVIREKTVLLGGPVIANYYHCMVNWLSRLAILKMLRPEVFYDDGINILVDEGLRKPPYADILLASGLDPKRFVWTHGDDVILKSAVLVSFGNRDETCPEVVSAMRELFAPTPSVRSDGRRRLWISRQALGPNRRRVANMDEISPVLAAHGLESLTLEEMPAADQISMFQSAEAIVGIHGAGLTNMIFSPADCRVISIESDLNLKLGTSKFYSTLAEASGLAYGHLKVKRAARGRGVEHNFANVHSQDYLVPPEALDAILKRFLPPGAARADAGKLPAA